MRHSVIIFGNLSGKCRMGGFKGGGSLANTAVLFDGLIDDHDFIVCNNLFEGTCFRRGNRSGKGSPSLRVGRQTAMEQLDRINQRIII